MLPQKSMPWDMHTPSINQTLKNVSVCSFGHSLSYPKCIESPPQPKRAGWRELNMRSPCPALLLETSDISYGTLHEPFNPSRSLWFWIETGSHITCFGYFVEDCGSLLIWNNVYPKVWHYQMARHICYHYGKITNEK